ncbi:MAG: hypothetical protein JW734_03290 [Candidatus Omnitrophica bacterium]|nr:hypothetical protein [Candidatus Omnitrophota bacterium]
MSKKIIVLTAFLFLFVVPQIRASYDDNIYGDYLISVSKKTISMDLENASLIDTLKVLSQQTGLNFVSSEAVRERKLTLYLEQVPLRQALDTIFKANNLTYEFYPESNIFIVKELGKPTLELQTRVYYLKYARVKSSRLFKEIKTALEREEGEEDDGEKDETGVLEAVRKVITEYGKVVEDPRTNSLIVTDVASQFPIIESVVKSLDVAVQKVIIEVEVLDVAKDLVDKLGIKFSEGLYAEFTAGKRDTSFLMTGNNPSRRAEGDDALFPKSAVTLGTLDMSDFQVILQFFSEDTSTKFLARPKILTLSGETAEIKLTVDEAVGVKKTKDADTGEVQYEIERAETGSSLRVTPHANPDTNEITMLVEPKVVKAELSGYTFEDFIIKDIQQRGTKSVVMLKEGQTLIIGGLLRRDETVVKTKVPFFGDIPFLGAAFRHNDSDVDERELLVFLTPRIMEDLPTTLSSGSLFEEREQTQEVRQSAIDSTLAKFE